MFIADTFSISFIQWILHKQKRKRELGLFTARQLYDTSQIMKKKHTKAMAEFITTNKQIQKTNHFLT